MKRAIITAMLLGLIGLLGACKSGGTTPGTTPITGGPLTLLLAAASPTGGLAPVAVTFTGSISGGTAPFDFAWDFENDGSFDAFVNQTFNRTASRQHVYHLRAEDAAAGVSTYEAVLRVRDATGAQRISDPIIVTVTSSQTLAIDPSPTRTFVFTDEQDVDGNYIFRSGRPTYFRVGLIGGTAPFTYHWDFDNDGTIDSTVSNPQYVFTNNQFGVRTFVAQLMVVDAMGERAFFSFTIPVEGQPLPPGMLRDFGPEAVNVVTNPLEIGGVITLRFDPTAAPSDPLPRQPRLDVSANVMLSSPVRGVAPYEFYWDFENDNRIDALSSSASVPYYDPIRRVDVNPYLHDEQERTFTLRLLVIDSAGQRQTRLFTVRVINMQDRPADSLSLSLSYGPGTLDQQYATVNGSTDSVVVQFRMDLSGSTGIYQYQIDITGNDVVDIPEGGGWEDAGASTTVPVTFGLYDHDDDPSTDPESVFPVPQFYPAKITVRSLESVGGDQADILTVQAPLSIVQVGGLNEENVDTNLGTPEIETGLDARQDHVMVGFSEIDTDPTSGPNGQTLRKRGVMIAGGAKGTGALNTMFRIEENFNPPTDIGLRETRAGNVVMIANTEGTSSLGTARRGAVGGLMTNPNDPQTGANAQFYVWGGQNPSIGGLFTGEFQDFGDGFALQQWQPSGAELRSGGTPFTLFDGASSVRAANALWITGGLHRPQGGGNAVTSGATFVFDPGGPLAGDDGFSTERSLRIPRYELQTVVIGNHIYAIGGRTATGQSVSVVEVLDIAAPGPWREVASMQDPRAGHSAEVIDGRIYVYGGANFGGQGNTKTLLTTAEVYNPATDSWSRTVPLHSGRATYDGTAVRLPGPGSVFGAAPAERRFNTVWYYGGEGVVAGQSREVNFLQEFIYFYSVSP